MKRNNILYWYVKSFHLTIYWQVFVLYFNPTISSTYKHYYKVISQGNGKLVAYTPCLKCHDHSKLTGLRRMYVGINPLVCINNLLITPVGNVLMRLGCQGIKGLRILVGNDFFSNLEIIWSWKPYLCPVTHSYSDILVLRKIQYFITKTWCIGCAKNFNLTILLNDTRRSKTIKKIIKFGFSTGWINIILRKRNVYSWKSLANFF